MKVEDIQAGQSLSGIEPGQVVAVMAAVPIGEGTVQLIYRTADGHIRERLLGRADEAAIDHATAERPFAFDGDGAAFRLACEAKRIDLAFLFDPMMAVHTSNVDPLPHQITAIYESMLPRQPLRFVLADDPGAGKTIMAGLYIRELIMRADAHRILIVAPGSLVEQWRDELFEKFGLEFHVYSSLMEQTAPSGNPFDDYPKLIGRLDQLARSEELQDQLCAPGWDLVVFDEAHKLSAHYFGSKLEKTARFRFAEKLGAHTRHLLLMTATPLFPERRAYTVNYTLSTIEAALYESVTDYVKTEMGKADELKGARKGSVGFALTALQRRLASSPEAIFQSLKRRRERLENRLREENLGIKGKQAKAVVASGQDRKWDELSQILQNNPEMRDAAGRQRKLIVFSEHRDTLNYLHGKIAGVLGNADAIVTIHERFGRIHRIGQQEVCHLWNLVAKETREGDVYHRLLKKLEVESEAFKGRVFDILGEVFEETSLKDLLLEAIRYGDRPDVRARLSQKLDQALDRDHLRALLNRNALAQETMSAEQLFAVKEEMEKAAARRLQPYFVRAFFVQALDALGGTLHTREAGRCEITHVPYAIRERDRRLTGRNRREHEPVLKRYSRICFNREAIQPLDKPGVERAVLMHPGHPLMLALSDLLLERYANLLRQGAVLIDPADEGHDPPLLFLLTHEIKSGDGLLLSKRLQFVRVGADGQAVFAGWAPHLDLEPLPEAERPLLTETLAAPWNSSGQEARAVALAAATLVPEHYNEVANRRIAQVDKTLAAVHERLSKEIAFWQDRWLKLKEDGEAGKDIRLNLQNVTRTIADLGNRLEGRQKALQAQRHVVNGTPVVLGAALIVPTGLMNRLRGEEPIDPVAATFAADAQARARIERLAMDAVRQAEESRGCQVVDVSAVKCGWDLTSYPPARDGKQPEARHIEVKGRVQGASTITVTRNEILYAFNQGDKFVLAIVLVDGEQHEGPYYVRRPFTQEPGWAVTSINLDLKELLRRSSLIEVFNET